MLVDAHPITYLLFLTRHSNYPMREYEELSVLASWVGFDGIVNRRPEVEIKRNGDRFILDEIVQARLGRTIPEVCHLIALVTTSQLRD